MSTLKKITLFSSKGKNKQVIETTATTWGELKPLVAEHYNLSNLQPTESVNKTTLLHVDAALPDSDFVLFLRPIKTKSGTNYSEMDFHSLRNLLTNEDKETLQEQTGRNWTRCSRTEIEEFLSSKKVVEETMCAEVEEETFEDLQPLEGSLQEEIGVEAFELTVNSSIDSVTSFLLGEIANIRSDIKFSLKKLKQVEKVIKKLPSMVITTNVQEGVVNSTSKEEEAAEQARLELIAEEKAEQRRLAEQADELERGFN